MNIAQFNARGPNNGVEHWFDLIHDELINQGHQVRQFWLRGNQPTRDDIEWMDFAMFHFAQVALHYMRLPVPFCVLPSANDVFPDNGAKLIKVSKRRNCKFITYQSFYHLKKYKEWGIKHNFVYVPMPVRTELFKRKRKYNPNGKIVAGGRLVPKKGLDRLVNVDNLTIFGDGPLESELKSLMPNTTFTGRLSGEELRDLFDEASLYLFPAIVTPDGDSDGIANTLKESLLMELPVVASSVAGTPELNNINILDDLDNISMKISSILKKPNIKGRKEILKKYSPDVCVEKLLNAIGVYI